jgi:HlyD family secretion protein
MTIPFADKLPKLSRLQWGILIIVVALVGKHFLFPSAKDLGATFTVSVRDFPEQVSVSGSVVAAKDVSLGFSASGRVSGVYARVGERVSQGSVIAETENNDLVAMLSQKRFALAEAKANLASIKAGTRPEELAVAQASVQNAQLALIDAVQGAYTSADDAVHNKSDTFFLNPRTDAKLTLTIANASLKTSVEADRKALEPVLTAWATSISNLSVSTVEQSAQDAQAYTLKVTSYLANVNSAINQASVDQTTTTTVLASYNATLATARSNVNLSASTLSTSRATLSSAKANLALKQAGSTPEAITAQEAVVAAAEADVEQAVSALNKTRVVAPFTGVVTKMDAKVGEIISPTASLIGMQSDGIFQIETYVPEVAISSIAVGNPATTTLDAYGSATAFPATVIRIDPAETIKDGVPAYKTTLSFASADARIRSGMTADVLIETGLLKDAIVVPAGAVGARTGEQYVSVVEKGTAVSRPVTTGSSPALGQAHILSGLSAGEQILLTPVK